ncbi:hypothetical protein [Corynebacterium vitaeruminis]|nr:hypothetical protein [Corynebacterium vitaeruminis]
MFDQFNHIAEQFQHFNPFQQVQQWGAQVQQNFQPQNWFNGFRR